MENTVMLKIKLKRWVNLNTYFEIKISSLRYIKNNFKRKKLVTNVGK